MHLRDILRSLSSCIPPHEILPFEPKVKLVLITTRAGAKKRDEKLPDVFEEKKDAQRP